VALRVLERVVLRRYVDTSRKQDVGMPILESIQTRSFVSLAPDESTPHPRSKTAPTSSYEVPWGTQKVEAEKISEEFLL
jgi:hypothetical protein